MTKNDAATCGQNAAVRGRGQNAATPCRASGEHRE